MRNPIKSSRFELWTFSQRKTVLVFCVITLVFLAVESKRKPILLTDPLPETSSRAGEIQDRINPNTADAAALSAIPNLGEKRARQIVAFRDEFVKSHPGKIAFAEPDDLMQIKGIGAGIVANLEPFLTFGPMPVVH